MFRLLEYLYRNSLNLFRNSKEKYNRIISYIYVRFYVRFYLRLIIFKVLTFIYIKKIYFFQKQGFIIFK